MATAAAIIALTVSLALGGVPDAHVDRPATAQRPAAKGHPDNRRVHFAVEGFVVVFPATPTKTTGAGSVCGHAATFERYIARSERTARTWDVVRWALEAPLDAQAGRRCLDRLSAGVVATTGARQHRQCDGFVGPWPYRDVAVIVDSRPPLLIRARVLLARGAIYEIQALDVVGDTTIDLDAELARFGERLLGLGIGGVAPPPN